MRAILTAIYNRVYQTGFEDETLFPVSISNISHSLSFKDTNLAKGFDFLGLYGSQNANH